MFLCWFNLQIFHNCNAMEQFENWNCAQNKRELREMVISVLCVCVCIFFVESYYYPLSDQYPQIFDCRHPSVFYYTGVQYPAIPRNKRIYPPHRVVQINE